MSPAAKDFLSAERLEPLDENFRSIAEEVAEGKKGDLVLDPGPASGPINFLAYPVLEVGGKPVKVPVTFSFVRRRSGA